METTHTNGNGNGNTLVVKGEKLSVHEAAERAQEIHDRNVAALTTRVQLIKSSKLDAVADTRALVAVPIPSGDTYPAQVILKAPGGLTMQIGEVAADQLGQLFKIPSQYFDRMNHDAVPLLASNLNWWLQQAPAERLLRMLKPDAYSPEEQAQMRAMGAAVRLRGVLGKGYRTVDDSDYVAAVLPDLLEQGAQLQDFSIDERRLHAKFFLAPRDVQSIKREYAARYGVDVKDVGRHVTVNGVDRAWVNEVISAGVVIRHSEIGFASIGASFVTRVLKCLNDYVAENSISIRHVGGKNTLDDSEDVRFLSDSTKMIENAALLGRVRDGIRHALSAGEVAKRAETILVAKETLVDRPAGTPLFEFVGNIGANLGLTEPQTEQLKEETLKSVGEEGGESLFSIVQGITAVAKELTDYDRRLELERTGFALLSDDPAKLLALAEAPTKRKARGLAAFANANDN